MKTFRTIFIIGVLEILIGGLTLLGNLVFSFLDLNNKSPNVLLFVIITAAISTLIGIGILKLNKAAYDLLIYFSSVIILTKLLIFAGIVHLNGELELSIHKIFIPAPELLKNTMNTIKNLVSVGYHAFVLYYLSKPQIKMIFHR